MLHTSCSLTYSIQRFVATSQQSAICKSQWHYLILRYPHSHASHMYSRASAAPQHLISAIDCQLLQRFSGCCTNPGANHPSLTTVACYGPHLLLGFLAFSGLGSLPVTRQTSQMRIFFQSQMSPEIWHTHHHLSAFDYATQRQIHLVLGSIFIWEGRVEPYACLGGAGIPSSSAS